METNPLSDTDVFVGNIRIKRKHAKVILYSLALTEAVFLLVFFVGIQAEKRSLLSRYYLVINIPFVVLSIILLIALYTKKWQSKGQKCDFLFVFSGLNVELIKKKSQILTACFAVFMILQLIPLALEVFICRGIDFHSYYMVFGFPIVCLIFWSFFSKHLN